jgi:peptidoglycan hydrolase-like protein with peptidoglycan-binding domain
MDYWPDTSELTPSERCDTGLKLPNGQPAYLFSDYNATTVERQFSWMRQNHIDGVMQQLFAPDIENPAIHAERNQVTRNVMAGAEMYGRTFNVMYDISGGGSGATLTSAIENDWITQVDTLRSTSSSRYLHQDGLPVVALWGFGFGGSRLGTPADLATLLDFFHNNPNPAYRAVVMGGVPNDWRTNSTWAAALTQFDVVSPWMVGRINSVASADAHTATTQAELSYATAHHQMYMPVIFPGYSFHNQDPAKPLNEIPRLGGQFIWEQAYNDISRGVTMIYGAMFDEVNEGTGMFQTAPTSADWPVGLTMVPLNTDGNTGFTPDHYLQVDDGIGQMLRGAIPLTRTMPALTPPTPTPQPPSTSPTPTATSTPSSTPVPTPSPVPTSTPTPTPPTPAPAPAPSPPSGEATVPVGLPIGATGTSGAVADNIQELLQLRGYPQSVNGYFGSATTAHVRSLQSQYGMASTGIVDGPTWQLLVTGSPGQRAGGSQVADLPELAVGSTGSAVQALQALLALHHQNAQVNGSFGSRTDAAVQSFQASLGLTPTDIVDATTWFDLLA